MKSLSQHLCESFDKKYNIETINRILVSIMQYGTMGASKGLSKKQRGDYLNYLIDDMKYVYDKAPLVLTPSGLEYVHTIDIDKYAK